MIAVTANVTPAVGPPVVKVLQRAKCTPPKKNAFIPQKDCAKLEETIIVEEDDFLTQPSLDPGLDPNLKKWLARAKQMYRDGTLHVHIPSLSQLLS